jgi:hypothetical protein
MQITFGGNMKDPEPRTSQVPLLRSLSVITQLNVPGTAGRLAQQIRDIEAVAPVFGRAGLVRKVQRPSPLNIRAAGVATATPTPARVLGGFLYAAVAVRLDLIVQDNRISTGTQDSTCEVDDIDYEDQKLRLELISLRQTYELLESALRDGVHRELIIVDSPLLASRAMVAPRDDAVHRGHREAYEAAILGIERFWRENRDTLYPWAEDGPVVVSLGSGRYGAMLQLAQQDLRTDSGRRAVLETETIDATVLEGIAGMEHAILSIGQQRFLNGLLGPFTRTVGYRVNVQSPRMEPAELAGEGVVGFHFRGAQGTAVRFAQLLGPESGWTTRKLDDIAGLLMGLSAIVGPKAKPLPIMLAQRELNPAKGFLESYVRQVREHLRSRKLEEGWLDGLDELD